MLFLKSISKRGGGAKWISGRWMNINNWVKGEKSTLLSALAKQKQKLWRGYDQIKENRSLSPWGWMVPILKMRRFSCRLRLSLPPEMGEIAQTFMSEIEWLATLKCRATGLSTSLFSKKRRCSANLSDRLSLYCLVYSLNYGMISRSLVN